MTSTDGQPTREATPRWLRIVGSPALNSPVVGLLPWIVFWIVAGLATSWWQGACLAALALSAVALVIDVCPRELGSGDGARSPRARTGLRPPKLLNAGTLVFFLVLSLMEPLLSEGALVVVEIYSQVIADGALTVVILVPMLAGYPFTVQYARETTPPDVWGTPRFRRVNVLLSWLWIVSFALGALLGIPVALLDPSSAAFDWCLWYIPAVLVVVPLGFTIWYPAYAGRRTRRVAPSA